MEASLRHGGIVGSYGGEEFVALFLGLDLETAKKVAERLRKAIAHSPVQTHKGPITMTVSIGLAHVAPRHGHSQDAAFFESVLNIADEALYTAKQSGRNCLVVAPYLPGTAHYHLQRITLAA
jgi:diguanylate cyclase (GGDEF)-like protein